MNEQTQNKDEMMYSVNVETKKEVSTSTQVWRSFEAIGVEFGNIMESVFADYIGIEFLFDNGIKPFIYFKTGDVQLESIDDNGKKITRVRAFEDIKLETTEVNNIGLAAYNIGSYARQKKKHKITKAGKDILSSLVWCNKPNDYKWNDSFMEETITTGYVGNRPFNQERIKLFGTDFEKLLRFIKVGGIDDIANDRKYRFRISQVPCQRYQAAGVFYNSILCIDIDNLNEFDNIAKKYHVGVVPQFQMNGNIITPGAAV